MLKLSSADNKFLRIAHIQIVDEPIQTEDGLTDDEVDAIAAGLEAEGGDIMDRYEAHVDALRRMVRDAREKEEKAKEDAKRSLRRHDSVCVALLVASGVICVLMGLLVSRGA